MNELREYLENNSQAAFAALVDRYINLVYSAAVRHVGDRTLAEDVTQRVFTVLVQKASTIPPERPLSAWLLATTRYISLAERKQRTNRQRREQRAAAMKESITPNSQSDFAELGPILDEALAELRDGDRDALMLRYFDCRSMREVGTALGVSEEAAIKRVSRALDRLRELFAARGITTASAAPALEALAGSNAAPEALRQTIVSLATSKLAGGAVATGVGTMTMMKVAVIAATVTILACGVGVAVYPRTPAPPPTAAAATQSIASGPMNVTWTSPVVQNLLTTARDECFPPPVTNYLLASSAASQTIANFSGLPLMTQANSVDHNGVTWLAIVLATRNDGSATLQLGNTDMAGPSGVITDTNALLPVQRMARAPRGAGQYRVSAKIAEPWAVGEFKSFCWISQTKNLGAKKPDGTYPMMIANSPGIDCIQQLVLVLPKTWKLRSSTEPAVATQSIGDFSIRFWRKHVTANDSFRVDLILERAS